MYFAWTPSERFAALRVEEDFFRRAAPGKISPTLCAGKHSRHHIFCAKPRLKIVAGRRWVVHSGRCGCLRKDMLAYLPMPEVRTPLTSSVPRPTVAAKLTTPGLQDCRNTPPALRAEKDIRCNFTGISFAFCTKHPRRCARRGIFVVFWSYYCS